MRLIDADMLDSRVEFLDLKNGTTRLLHYYEIDTIKTRHSPIMTGWTLRIVKL